MTDKPDLYGELELPRDASPEAVRKAYRKKAKSAHPDANPGDPDAAEKFHAVQLAHDVLMDPERRAHYDATGSIASENMDDTLTVMMSVLSSCLTEVLSACERTAKDPTKLDLATAIRAALQGNITRLERSIAATEKQRDALKRLLGRFTQDDSSKPNHLETIILSRIIPLELEIENTRAGMDINTAAKSYLAGLRYRFEHDPEQDAEGMRRGPHSFSIDFASIQLK